MSGPALKYAPATETSGPDASELIADHLARVTFDDLPADVVAHTKILILDTLACIYAGTGTPEVQAITSLMREQGGRETSTLIGQGGKKVPAVSATFVNAATVHQYDFDDTHDTAICHPTSTSLAPALSLAEQRGNVSGRDLITAVALGNDITSRVAHAIGGRLDDFPWFRAPVVGLFGATAAATKMLGGSAEQHRNAFGLALPMNGGTLASLHQGGSSVRSIRDGLSYRNGVLAAELAMRGVRGDAGVFDGPYGFYRVFFGGEYHRNRLVDELGSRYETKNVSLKPWPAIRHLHASLTAVLELMTQHNLAFDDIESVAVHGGQNTRKLNKPVNKGDSPARRMDLLSTLCFVIAAAIRHRGVPLAIYRDTRIADDVIETAMPRVQWVFDDAMTGAETLEKAHVEIRTRGGQTHVRECARALGHPDHPMSREQLHTKLRECAEAAVVKPSPDRLDDIIAAVENLERVDVGAFVKLLA